MSIQDPNDRQPSATPGERPKTEAETYSNAAENALNLIAEACGFAREWDYPLQIVRDVEDRMRELNALKAASPGERQGELATLLRDCWSALDGRGWTALQARIEKARHDLAAATPGERPVDDGVMCSAHGGSGQPGLGCGPCERHEAPFPPAPGERTVEPRPESVAERMRARALDALAPGEEPTDWYSALDDIATMPGESVPGGGPPRCEVFDSLTGMRCAREAGHPGMHAHDDSEHPGVTAPAVSPPLRDEPTPPPGMRLVEHGAGLFRVERHAIVTAWGDRDDVLRRAREVYDSEHGYAPAAPSTREPAPPLRDEPATPEGGREESREGWEQVFLDDGCEEWRGPTGARAYLIQKGATDFLTVVTAPDEGSVVDDVDVPIAVVRRLFAGAPDLAAPSTREGPGEDPRGHFLRELASEFFHGTTFDDLIAASPDEPASAVIADELYRRAAAFGGVAGR